MASRKDSFSLTVVGESGVVYYGDCKILFVPSGHESVAILPQHTPMIMKLSKGEVIAQEGHTKRLLASIDKGLIYVGENEVTVIVDV